MKNKKIKLFAFVLVTSMFLGTWSIGGNNVLARETINKNNAIIQDIGTFVDKTQDTDNAEIAIQDLENNPEQFTGFAGGDGSEENPYQISTEEMFREMAEYKGQYFVLISDLDLSDSQRINFEGTFDGNGYTIETGFSEENGMFNKLEETSLVENCNINIGNGYYSSLPAEHFGAVSLKNYGLIKKCIVSGSVMNGTAEMTWGDIAIGSICSKNYGKIEQCRSDVDYSVRVNIGSQFMLSGICNYGTAEQCLNTGNIYAQVKRNVPYGGISHNFLAGVGCGVANECANTGNISLDFSSLQTSSAGIYNYVGFISSDEFTSFSYKVPSKMNGINSCYISEDVQFSFSTYNLGSGGGVNSKSTVLYADDVKETQIKTKDEILKWWNSVFVYDEDDGGETWTPDGMFSISKSGAWVSGKECTLHGSYSASKPGNAEAEAKEIIWSSSDSSVLDVSDTTLDLNIADEENNHVSIQKSFTAHKAGTVTVTATTIDGRSESITVDIEPELVVIGTHEKLTEETEVTLFQATISEPNAEYLEKFISQVKVDIKDSSNESFTVTDHYYVIADDGMSAKIVYVLKPIWHGDIEFQAISMGGQVCDIIVYNGLWSNLDQWSFKNYIVDKLPLQENMYTSITSGLNNSQKKFFNDELINQKYNGQCYGMAVTATLVRQGVLPLSDIQTDLTNLYYANKTDSAKSLIGYYHLNQFTDSALEVVDEFRSLGIENQLETLISESTPYVLSFACDGWGGHAVVAWGHETGSWSFHNHTYDTRIRIYDSNYCDFNQDAINSFLYFNSETYEWEIPNYYANGISSDGNGYLKRACGDSLVLTDNNFASGQYYQAWLINRNNSPFFAIFNDNNYFLQGENFENTDKYMTYYTEDINISSNGTPSLNVFFKEISDYVIEPSSDDKLDMGILYPDYYLSIEADSYDQLSFEQDGAISAILLGEDYDISVTADDEQCNLPWYTVEISGKDTNKISAEWTVDGVLVTGDNLENVNVVGSNDNDAQELTFSTDEDSVLISESDNELVVLIDTNNDGVYDTDVNEKEEHIHKYGVPKFIWSENYSSCTAVFNCEFCGYEQKIECDISSETTIPMCAEDGKTVYTATVSFGDKEYNDLQEKVLSATGHTYEYKDNGDGTHTKMCTAGDDTIIEPHIYQDGVCIECGASAASHKLGDVNMDNKIDISDATIVQEYLAFLITEEDTFCAEFADVDKNGIITINDATEIQKIIAKTVTAA